MDEIEWGETTEDLAISLSVAKPKYQVNEPIELKVALKNDGAMPMPIVARSPWGEYTLRVWRGAAEVPTTPYALNLIEGASLGPRANAELQPGEVQTRTFELDKGFDMTAPGPYRVVATRATYKKGQRDQFAVVTSNEITVKVVP